MNVVAIIQARMGSTRLPGKVMKKIGEKPILEILINRLKKSQYIDEIIIATTLNKVDKQITALSKKLGIKCYCGSENDVLDRYLKTAEKFNAEVIVRVTADNPLTDPVIVDKLIDKHLKSESDYTYCNDLPVGVSVEVFNKSTLKKLSIKDLSPVEKEHVTLYIKSNPQKFKIAEFNSNLNFKDIRLTVDTPKDLKLINLIYNHFKSLEGVTTKDIINFFEENPND